MPDSARPKIYNEITWGLRNYSPEVGLMYGNKAINWAKDMDNVQELAKAYSYIGVCHRNLGNFADAMEYYNLGVEIAEKNNFSDQQAYGYINIGNLMYLQKNYDESLEWLLKAEKIAMDTKDSNILGYVYLNLGRVCRSKNDFDKAIDYQRKTYKIRLETKSNQLLSVVKDLGDIYLARNMVDSAKYNYHYCINSPLLLSDVDLASDIYASLANIYYDEKKYDSSLFYGYEALRYAKQISTKLRIKNAYEIIGKVFYAQGDYKNAALNYSNQITFNDSIFNEQLAQKIFDIKFSAEQYKNEVQIDGLEKDKKYQQNVIFLFVGLLILGIIIAIIIIRNSKKIKKLNKELEHQKKQIYDSISYAKNIQQAILPELSQYGKVFSDKFVIYKPKDIVSGDFYWHFEDDDHELLAVADGTGHGVPGAFMSMLGTSMLQEIALSKERKASEILERLRKMVKTILHQEDISNAQKDGMDIALVVIDKKTRILEYAGAYIPLYYIRNNELFQLKAVKNPIAIFLVEKPFKSETLQLQEGDCLYMSSDGFTSQFRGKDKAKMRQNQYKDLLLKNHKLPMAEQAKLLDKFFTEWQGDCPQVDDVLVAGFRV